MKSKRKKNKYSVSLLLMLVLCLCILVSCVNEKAEENKPLGAETFEYKEVESINNNGPEFIVDKEETRPPMGKKTEVEKGPVHIDVNEKDMLPMASEDPFVDFGVPINMTESSNNGS